MHLLWIIYKPLFLQWFIFIGSLLLILLIASVWRKPIDGRCVSAKEVLIPAIISALTTIFAVAVFIFAKNGFQMFYDDAAIIRFASDENNFLIISVIYEFGFAVFAILTLRQGSLTFSDIGFDSLRVKLHVVVVVVVVSFLLVVGLKVFFSYYLAEIDRGVGILSYAPVSLSGLHAIIVSSGALYKLWMVVFPPLIEEVVFRGVLLAYCARLFPFWFSVLFQAAAFAAIHTAFDQFFVIFILGVIFALVYRLTRTIFAPILLHSVVELVSVF